MLRNILNKTVVSIGVAVLGISVFLLIRFVCVVVGFSTSGTICHFDHVPIAQIIGGFATLAFGMAMVVMGAKSIGLG